MSLKLRREHTGNRQIEQIQRESQRVADKGNGCPFLDGNLVTGVEFSGTNATTIDHGLGRAPQGCIAVRSYGTNAAPPPKEASSQPSDLSLQIALQTTATSTFDLWFW